MTREDQAEFIRELTANVVGNIVADIEAGKVPETWDGIELRQLLADRMAQVVWFKMTPRWAAEYRNTVLINNL